MSKHKSLADRRHAERFALPRPSREGGRPEYWVIKARSVEALVKKHDELAEVGWRVTGGVCVHRSHYVQAMIRE